MRVRVRVRPGSSRPAVGGRYDDCLVVAVTSPAVDGRATEAVVLAVAAAFGLRRSRVRLVGGARARTKLLELDDDSGHLAPRLAELLGPETDTTVTVGDG